jgi:23S rRNA (cytidine2498-2'-O)-methyltransferase
VPICANEIVMTYPKQLAFVAPGFKSALLDELEFLNAKVLRETEHVIWVEDSLIEPAFAQGVWRDVQALEFSSITDAQTKLQALSPVWRYHGGLFHRRGELIAEKVNTVLEIEKYHFTAGVVKKMPPAFTLVESGLILYSRSVSRPSLSGEMNFKESRKPPSRAYLKLWEALTLLGDWPGKSSEVVDLGSSPGSWTWALAKLGAKVLSVDRSKLDPLLDSFSNVQFKAGDAFSLKPEKKEWVFSDVICYPDKVFEYMKVWLDSGHCDKFVCSVKFAGTPNFHVIQQFRSLPHSRVVHLTSNKNEVTWIRHPKIKLTA